MSALSQKEDMAASIDRKYRQWCQKKRPATPELRSELLRVITESRKEVCVRVDGGPLTEEDRRHIRYAQRVAYREARAFVLRVENHLEARFWMFLAKHGIQPEGGLQ